VTQLDYVPAPGFFDELFEGPGVPRAPASALTDKGVYRGAAEAEHDVSVKMTRLD
jgi:hypothetical protein